MPIFGIPGSLRGDRGGGRNEEDRSIKECRLFEYASLKKPFAGRVVCGLCDRAFGRRIWNSTDDRLRRVMWQCSAKYEIKGIRVATINILMMGCCIRALLMCCFGREQGLLHGKVAGAAAKRQCAGAIQGETVYRHYC